MHFSLLIRGLNRFSLAALVAYPVLLSTLLNWGTFYESDVVDCTYELTSISQIYFHSLKFRNWLDKEIVFSLYIIQSQSRHSIFAIFSLFSKRYPYNTSFILNFSTVFLQYIVYSPSRHCISSFHSLFLVLYFSQNNS